MLISCTSCNSKYLVNSAELKPHGRTVQCVKCGNQWYQDPKLDENNDTKGFVASAAPLINSKKKPNNSQLQVPNLPSTYVKEQKVSILNSILVVLFIFIFIGSFWVFKNLEINTLVFFKFYFEEFIFNLKLIINDIAKIIDQIIN